jgi:hypothetical protein
MTPRSMAEPAQTRTQVGPNQASTTRRSGAKSDQHTQGRCHRR